MPTMLIAFRSARTQLRHRMTANPHQSIPSGVKDDVLAYYADLSLPFATKKKPEQWAAVQRDLAALQKASISPEPVPFQTYDGNSDQ